MPRASVPALCGGAVRVFLICEDDREDVEAQAGPRAHGALRAYDEWLRTELKHYLCQDNTKYCLACLNVLCLLYSDRLNVAEGYV